VFHTHCVRWGCGCGGLALAELAHQVFHLLLSDIFSSLFYDLISICIVHILFLLSLSSALISEIPLYM
jgi:hypothetical protein